MSFGFGLGFVRRSARFVAASLQNFLLMEAGTKLLLEDGFFIILE